MLSPDLVTMASLGLSTSLSWQMGEYFRLQTQSSEDKEIFLGVGRDLAEIFVPGILWILLGDSIAQTENPLRLKILF
jgi:hypothetical protein